MRRSPTLTLALLAALLVAAPRAQADAPQGTVLVLMPVQPGRPAYDGLLAGLIESLQQSAAGPPLVSVENLGEPDPDDKAGWEAQWAWLRTKYRTRRIDAIVTIGQPQHDVRAALGVPSTTPVAFAGAAGLFEPARLPASTGVMGSDIIAPNVRLVRDLLPETQRLALVGGNSPADRIVNDQMLRRLRAVAGGLHVDDLTGLSLTELEARVPALPRTTALFVGLTLVDHDNRTLSHPLVVSALRRRTSAPIFAPLDTALGQGIVGGAMVRPEHVGGELGRLVLRLLAGESPDAIPVQTITPHIALDWRELRRLGIPESRIPAGADIAFRDPSLLSRNPALVLATTGVVLIQAALIAWLAIEQRRRRRTEAELAERMRFEAMLHEVSERLANMPADRVDEQMPDVLRTLGQALDVDRCSLVRFVPERGSFAPFARWCRSGSTAGIDRDVLTRSGLTEIERVVRGEPVVIPDVVSLALPPETAEMADRQGVRAILGMPIRIDGRTVAVLVLATATPRAWSAHEISALRPVAEILGTALLRLQQDREARAHRDTLSHLDRVAVLGELASSLAHELNQPLGAILANAEAARLLLAADPPRLQDLRAALDDIVSDDERAGEIIKNMRAMIRRRPPTTEPVDVREAVNAAVRLVQQDAVLRRCRIEVVHAETPHVVLCDRIQLQQVVLNLLGNALDACSEQAQNGHAIRVETRVAGGRTVTLSVRDHGPGLADEIVGRMFEPFFSTKSSGLGVGLTICRSIVETYGGWITAENADGGGAVFTVHLPAGTA